MNNPDDKTKILLDADVIRNFLSGEKLNILCKIFPRRFCIIDRVREELFRSKNLKGKIEKFILEEQIEIIKFPDDDMDIVFEYAKLLSYGLGDGESACLSFARYRKKYISSSNLKDVANYCREHSITNIPTMELLKIAKNKNLLTENEINVFLSKCINDGHKLPSKTWKEYEKKMSK